MNKTLIFAILVAAVLLVASVTGCRQTATGDESQQMGSELSDVDNLDKDLGNIDSELNDSALADVENLL
jgi:hypothetical protein